MGHMSSFTSAQLVPCSEEKSHCFGSKQPLMFMPAFFWGGLTLKRWCKGGGRAQRLRGFWLQLRGVSPRHVGRSVVCWPFQRRFGQDLFKLGGNEAVLLAHVLCLFTTGAPAPGGQGRGQQPFRQLLETYCGCIRGSLTWESLAGTTLLPAQWDQPPVIWESGLSMNPRKPQRCKLLGTRGQQLPQPSYGAR